MNIKGIIIACVAIAAMVGCDNIGNAPAGMSDQDAKNAINNMSPEQKIKAIASSPMPPAEKEAKYKEIEAETGVKAADVLSATPAAPGTGSAPAGN